DKSRKPADAKPMMSDPARPEMAQGAIKSLPKTYQEAAIRQAAAQPTAPPQLGPALPGDVAAFARVNTDQPGQPTPPPQQRSAPGPTSTSPANPAEQEAVQANHAQL